MNLIVLELRSWLESEESKTAQCTALRENTGSWHKTHKKIKKHTRMHGKYRHHCQTELNKQWYNKKDVLRCT